MLADIKEIREVVQRFVWRVVLPEPLSIPLVLEEAAMAVERTARMLAMSACKVTIVFFQSGRNSSSAALTDPDCSSSNMV